MISHSVRWVPNLWELSQLGSDILSWPPTVGMSRRRRGGGGREVDGEKEREGRGGRKEAGGGVVDDM